jgi:hypothetical protein
LTTWTQKYLKDAISDEIELAKLLNYGKLGGPRTARGALGSGGDAGTAAIPMWRRNWGAAGSLVSKLFLKISHDIEEGTVSAGASDRRRSVTESYADHPSVDAATWAAVSRAAIQLLTEMRDSA